MRFVRTIVLLVATVFALSGCEIVLYPADAPAGDASDVNAMGDGLDQVNPSDAGCPAPASVSSGATCATPGAVCSGPRAVCLPGSGFEMCTCVSGAWVCLNPCTMDGGPG